VISHLHTRAHLPYGGGAADVPLSTPTLSFFRSLFNDHMRPLYCVTLGYFIEIISLI
jgi:hypothetical protein